MSSDNAKPRATALPRLEWQGELDSAMAEIDDRLTHPRRRASDLNRPPVLPELGNVRVTSELLDEIAWRVAQQIRATGETATAATVTKALAQPHSGAAQSPRQAAPSPAAPVAPLPSKTEQPALEPGKVLMIRFKLPELPWPFRWLQRRSRKKQHPLTTARLRA
jgi:hypothetical protein